MTCIKCQGRMRIISFIEDVGLPGGLLRDYNTTPGSFDGFDFYYKCSAFRLPKTFGFDFHISTWPDDF
jgi:hypothetical protein